MGTNKMKYQLSIPELQDEFRKLGNDEIASHSLRFFKTGEGEYGAGDQFLGIRAPVIRQQVRKYRHFSLKEIRELLHSPFHEERLMAVLFLVEYLKKHPDEEEQVYNLYLAETAFINNWDLVDSSAHHIVGQYLFQRDRSPLYRMIKSPSLWERRIAVMSTFYFIKRKEYTDTLKLSAWLIDEMDSEDLIHKVVGWMLREIGNRDREVEEEFLCRHYDKMPRTMLRYAIEKFPESRRQQYLKGSI